MEEGEGEKDVRPGLFCRGKNKEEMERGFAGFLRIRIDKVRRRVVSTQDSSRGVCTRKTHPPR